jgi:phosphoserine phosphatase
MYSDGKISFSTWCEGLVKKYKDLGLNKKKLDQIIRDNMKIHDGVPETIHYLKPRGIKTAIISGGIYNLYDYFSKKHILKFDYVNFSTKLIFDTKGEIVDATYSSYDYDKEGKLEILKEMCKSAKVSLDEVVYVGDSNNDISVFKNCTGVAFASDSEELKKRAKHIIEGNNMQELLKYVNI